MSKRINQIFFIALICIVLALGFLFNMKEFAKIVYHGKNDLTVSTLKTRLLSFESNFKEKIKYRNELTGLYGVAMLGFQRSVIGNFEFIKDSDNVVHRIEGNPDLITVTKSFSELKQALDITGTPLIYINLPDSSKKLPLPVGIHVFSEIQPELLRFFGDNGIAVLDMDSVPLSTVSGEFYFKTDVHYTTEAEMWMAQHLCDFLSTGYDLKFDNYNTVFDISNYTTSSQDFLGNTAQNVGKYYVGYDKFTLFNPNFYTDLTVHFPSNNQTLEGSFFDTMTHQYPEGSPRYWVTNYAHYPSPCYTIKNNELDNAPSVLLIMDSLFMRSACFMSLVCSDVTVLDPRYFNGQEYAEAMLLNNKYDAVVFVGSSLYRSSFSSPSLSPQYIDSLPPAADPQDQTYTWLDWINGTVQQNLEVTVNPSQTLTKIEGWALDTLHSSTASHVIIEVDGEYFSTIYGKARESVSIYFGNPALLNSGYTAILETQKLLDAGYFSVHVISADGKYAYPPVQYSVTA